MRVVRSIHLYLAVAIGVMAVLVCILQCKQNPDYKILVIHSHESTFPNYKEFNRQIEKAFEKEGLHVETAYLYLDCNSNNADGELATIRNCLDRSTGTRKPDLILANDDQSLYSLLTTHHPLAKELPIVFGGVLYPNKKLLEQYPNVTGVTDSIALAENMQIAYELTGHRHSFIISNEKPLDRFTKAECQRQLAHTPRIINNLDWHYRTLDLSHLTGDTLSLSYLSLRNVELNTAMLNETDQRRKELGTGNIFYMLAGNSPYTYLQLKADASSQVVLNFKRKPQVTATYHYFGSEMSGQIAGYFTPTAHIARDEVAMAARILRGERPANLPIQYSTKQYFADWNNLKHLVTHIEDVPAKYTLVNATFKDYYPRTNLILSLIGIILLTTLFGYLLRLYLKERRAKQELNSRLARERVRLEMALQNSQAFAWLQEGDIIEMEDNFWAYVGEKPHYIHVDDFANYVHPDFRNRYAQSIRTIMRGEESVIELRCDFKGQESYVWWQIRANQMSKFQGGTESYGLLINIEHFKQREQELEEARKKAVQAELKESFLANMSHEIRTPLNAIVGFSNILASDMELNDEEKQEFVDTINKNNTLLLKLINDVLDLSRIESGQITMQMGGCRVEEMMETIHQSCLVQPAPGVEYIYRAGRSGLLLHTDEGRVEQVIANFLTNAAKFTLKGSITMGWEWLEESHEVELYVEDTGIGMSSEEQILAFDRFYKSDEFKQGTGLGLSICKVIAEKLNGRITLHSEPGKGSRFGLVLTAEAEV